jgi:hypothetical protein
VPILKGNKRSLSQMDLQSGSQLISLYAKFNHALPSPHLKYGNFTQYLHKQKIILNFTKCGFKENITNLNNSNYKQISLKITRTSNSLISVPMNIDNFELAKQSLLVSCLQNGAWGIISMTN